MSKDDTRETFTPDPTATRDIGGAYGGSTGTMAGTGTGPINDTGNAQRLKQTGADAAEQGRIGTLPDTSSDPNSGISVPSGDAPAYRASDDQGSSDHPMRTPTPTMSRRRVPTTATTRRIPTAAWARSGRARPRRTRNSARTRRRAGRATGRIPTPTTRSK